LQTLERLCLKIATLCDSLANPFEDQDKAITVKALNDYIEIQQCKHLTLRNLAHALEAGGISNRQKWTHSLSFIKHAIALCLRTDALIRALNGKLDRLKSQRAPLSAFNRKDSARSNKEKIANPSLHFAQKAFAALLSSLSFPNIKVPLSVELSEKAMSSGVWSQRTSKTDNVLWSQFQRKEIVHREESTNIKLFYFAAKLCLKCQKFEEALVWIEHAIDAATLDVVYRLKSEKDDLPMPPDFYEDDPSSSDDQSDSDSEPDDETMTDWDIMRKYRRYSLDHNAIKLHEDIERMQVIKETEWSEVDGEDKLFVYVQREIFDMVLLRGLAHSNLGRNELALNDSYLCVLLSPRNDTTWSNRAFAWFQLGQYENCMADCNFVLRRMEEQGYEQQHILFNMGLVMGNRGMAQYRLGHYVPAVMDLKIGCQWAPRAPAPRIALRKILSEFIEAIRSGMSEHQTFGGQQLDVPLVIAREIIDFWMNVGFEETVARSKSSIVI